MAGIYIHIPFCKQACSYCDFYFLTSQQHIPEFVDAILSEIENRELPDYAQKVETLYFGGGTPSLLSPAQLFMIIDALETRFDISNLSEFTVEVNPDDVTPGYIQALMDVGVTRVSMGIQSFQPELLEFMHRAHTKEEAHRSLEVIANSNLPSFTVDLIYGNPGQTEQQLEDDLEQILSYNPPHVSAYSLTLEPKTRLGKQFELGRLTPADDEMVARHMQIVESRLAERGLIRYEISNYAKPGYEAIHNANYWQHKTYLGFGPSAHSFEWDGESPVAKRSANIRNFKMYSTGKFEDPDAKEVLTEQELAEEYILLTLRTRKGTHLKKLEEVYSYRFNDKQLTLIDYLRKEAYISQDPELLSLTSKGMTIADELTTKIIAAG